MYLKGILKKKLREETNYRHNEIMTDIAGNFYSGIEWLRQGDI